MPSYKQSIVNYYGESRLEKVKDTLKTQGFKLEK